MLMIGGTSKVDCGQTQKGWFSSNNCRLCRPTPFFWLLVPITPLWQEEMRRRWQNLQRTGDPCEAPLASTSLCLHQSISFLFSANVEEITSRISNISSGGGEVSPVQTTSVIVDVAIPVQVETRWTSHPNLDVPEHMARSMPSQIVIGISSCWSR